MEFVKVWDAAKYSVGVKGLAKDEVAALVADLPVKVIKSRKYKGVIWVDYTGGARSWEGYARGLQVCEEVKKRIKQVAGEGKALDVLS